MNKYLLAIVCLILILVIFNLIVFINLITKTPKEKFKSNNELSKILDNKSLLEDICEKQPNIPFCDKNNQIDLCKNLPNLEFCGKKENLDSILKNFCKNFPNSPKCQKKFYETLEQKDNIRFDRDRLDYVPNSKYTEEILLNDKKFDWTSSTVRGLTSTPTEVYFDIGNKDKLYRITRYPLNGRVHLERNSNNICFVQNNDGFGQGTYFTFDQESEKNNNFQIFPVICSQTQRTMLNIRNLDFNTVLNIDIDKKSRWIAQDPISKFLFVPDGGIISSLSIYDFYKDALLNRYRIRYVKDVVTFWNGRQQMSINNVYAACFSQRGSLFILSNDNNIEKRGIYIFDPFYWMSSFSLKNFINIRDLQSLLVGIHVDKDNNIYYMKRNNGKVSIIKLKYNNPINILYPINNYQLTARDKVYLESNDTPNANWSSTIDGLLGSGVFSKDISPGVHTITASYPGKNSSTVRVKKVPYIGPDGNTIGSNIYNLIGGYVIKNGVRTKFQISYSESSRGHQSSTSRYLDTITLIIGNDYYNAYSIDTPIEGSTIEYRLNRDVYNRPYSWRIQNVRFARMFPGNVTERTASQMRHDPSDYVTVSFYVSMNSGIQIESNELQEWIMQNFVRSDDKGWFPYPLTRCREGYIIVDGLRMNMELPSVFGVRERNFSSKKDSDTDFSYTYNALDIPNKLAVFVLGWYRKKRPPNGGIYNEGFDNLKVTLYFQFTSTEDVVITLGFAPLDNILIPTQLLAQDYMNIGDVYFVKTVTEFYSNIYGNNLVGIEEKNFLT
jgi:hypothetical protein